MQEITVFYGVVGETMCKIIQTLAEKRGISQLLIANTKDTKIEHAMLRQFGICYFQEGIPSQFEKILSGNLLEWQQMFTMQRETGYRPFQHLCVLRRKFHRKLFAIF
jgi:hypothetical protein